jgi:Lon protease-like protein
MRVEPGHSCSDEAFLFRIPDRIPIFPLPKVVLFPKTYLPLHIFEPRYREMVRDAAAGHRCIGMTLLKEGWEANYYGAPPLYPIGCVGRLVRVQPLPDGRFDILLLGLERCLIEESFNDRSYREARIALRPDVPGEALPASLRAEVERLLTESPQLQQQQHGWQEVLRAEVADDILVNSLASLLALTPVERQFLLEAETIHQRSRRLCDLIQFKRHERADAKGWG